LLFYYKNDVFLLVVNYNPSVLHGHEDTEPYIFVVTILIFWGHVTSSFTWPFDSAYVVSYWWSIGTMRLSCTVTEI